MDSRRRLDDAYKRKLQRMKVKGLGNPLRFVIPGKNSRCKPHPLKLVLAIIVLGSFFTFLSSPPICQHSAVTLKVSRWIWGGSDPRYKSDLVIDWKEIVEVTTKLQKENKIGEIGLLNFNDREFDQWRQVIPSANHTLLSLEYAEKNVTWEVLFPEWIDEEQEEEVPTCPPLPKLHVPRQRLDLVAVKLPCRNEGNWSRDVARLHLQVAAAGLVGAFKGNYPVHLLFVTGCFPIPNLFTGKDLVAREGNAWLYRPELNGLRASLQLPIGSCELALPLGAVGTQKFLLFLGWLEMVPRFSYTSLEILFNYIMSRLLNFFFKNRTSQLKESEDIMEKSPTSNGNGGILQTEGSRGTMKLSSPSNADMKLLLFEDSNHELDDPCSEPTKPASNIISNHDFKGGLHSWHPNSCVAYVNPKESVHPKLSGRFAVVANRKECWQGLEQEITNRVSAGPTYTVCAWVGVSSMEGVTDMIATLKIESQDSAVSYQFIAKTSASTEHWEKLEGSFSLSAMPRRVTFYLEGPSPGIDLLIRSVVVSCNSSDSQRTGSPPDGDDNIIQNSTFDNGVTNWSGRGCKIMVHDSMGDGKVVPLTGKCFASTGDRTDYWNGIQQEITGRVQRKLAYEVTAVVRILGNNVTSANVRATLWVQAADLREQYIGITGVQATDKDWVQLQGKFLINSSPSRAVIFLEGPPPGTDILLNSMVVKHAAKVPPPPAPIIENPGFGVNIISNNNLSDGTNSWFSLGNCNLSVANGSPRVIPPMARDSLGAHEPLSGRYILVRNRTQTWMGPAQMITDKVKVFLTYQVSAWVRVGKQVSRPQNINVALGVDGQWVNGGQAEATGDTWHEIGGSFRIEKQASKVMIYIQGPEAGVDLMVAGLQVFPVDRRHRFRQLKNHTEKIRKRNVILKFTSSNSSSVAGTYVKIRQTQNSFPFGSCIGRYETDNEDLVDFFTKNFNWAVFENELKWYWTEPQRGNFNYKDADTLLSLCTSHDMQLRGHCIFWESEGAVQSWIRSLSRDDMMSAVQSRLKDLLTRYKGKFKHYDVNNEMLHNSFYQDHLGKDIRANMFKTANQLDPSPVLFVNDYSIEDGTDARSSPEKYINHILDLQEQGAPVGGIGIQGHITSPVGPVVCSALDKLGTLGLPIWFTEVDVTSVNEHVRADDLEVMIREAFAHPAVEGVMLWGFWELFMSRDNAHLVNAEGDLNEAGKRLLALKQEWLTRAHGYVNDEGEFEYRGFHGAYEVEVATYTKEKVMKKFVVDQGEDPVVISIDL